MKNKLISYIIKQIELRKKINETTQEVIDNAFGNTAGTILSKHKIKNIVKECYTNPHKSKSLSTFVDILFSENESEKGYLVKERDVLDAVNKK